MSALSTHLPELEHGDSPHFWVGKMSMALALSARRGDAHSKETVQEFLRSPLPSTELAKMLREELKA